MDREAPRAVPFLSLRGRSRSHKNGEQEEKQRVRELHVNNAIDNV